MARQARKSKLQGVLIVIEGGVADIRYVPPGIQVFIKDYDTDGACELDDKGKKCTVDTHRGDLDDDHYALIKSDFMSGHDKAAKKEAERLVREEL
jgi:hypothetical protein